MEERKLLRVSMICNPYDTLKYGRPWICKIIKWRLGVAPTVTWGKFIGDPQNGGILEIAAYTDDIVWVGQKVAPEFLNTTAARKSWYHVIPPRNELLGNRAELILVTPSQARAIWDKWNPIEEPLPVPTPNPPAPKWERWKPPQLTETERKIDLTKVSDEDLLNEVKRRGLILPPNGYKRHLSF